MTSKRSSRSKKTTDETPAPEPPPEAAAEPEDLDAIPPHIERAIRMAARAMRGGGGAFALSEEEAQLVELFEARQRIKKLRDAGVQNKEESHALAELHDRLSDEIAPLIKPLAQTYQDRMEERRRAANAAGSGGRRR